MSTSWKPIENFVIKDEKIRKQILEEGLIKLPKIPAQVLKTLREAFQQTHSKHQDGMFYSLYSKDMDYRAKTDRLIFDTLREVYDTYFTEYRPSFNLFIVKGAHTQDEFFIHQDPSYIDETKYSPLHVWIPLEDVNETNGALCYVPKSHKFFGPYRNISFAPPFENIRPFIRQYLQPVFLEAGEVLVFDPRVLHNSLPNNTDESRTAILTGIFPQQAEHISCYKDEEQPHAPIEFYKQQDDFFIVYPDFYESCRMRPSMGELIGSAPHHDKMLTEQDFADLCKQEGVSPVHFLKMEELANCKMIGEPIASAV